MTKQVGETGPAPNRQELEAGKKSTGARAHLHSMSSQQSGEALPTTRESAWPTILTATTAVRFRRPEHISSRSVRKTANACPRHRRVDGR
jgi:hypothetical protein